MKMRQLTLTRLLLLYVPPLLALAALSLLSAGQLGAAASAADRQGGSGKAGQAQSQTPGVSRPDGRPGGGGNNGRRRGGPPWLRVREPTEDEMTRVAAFMELHAPKRWKWYQGIQDEGRRNFMRRFLWWQFQQADELRNQNPPLYDLKVKRIEADDHVFAAALAVKEDGLTDEQRAEREDKLRGLVRNLVDLDLQEREARIEQLKKDLDREAKALNDLRNPEGFDRRVTREVNGILGLADNVRHGGSGGGNNRRDRRGGGSGATRDKGGTPQPRQQQQQQQQQ